MICTQLITVPTQNGFKLHINRILIVMRSLQTILPAVKARGEGHGGKAADRLAVKGEPATGGVPV